MAIESIEDAHRLFYCGRNQQIIEHRGRFYRVTLFVGITTYARWIESLYTRGVIPERKCTRSVHERSPLWSILEQLALQQRMVEP